MDNVVYSTEEKYKGIVESAKEGIAVAQHGKYVFANEAALNIIGYTFDELKEIPFVDLVHPDDREYISSLTIKMLSDKNAPNKFTFRTLCKDGTFKWVEVYVSIICWNGTGAPAALHLIIDTTAKRIADEQLFESEEKYKILVEKSNEGISVAQNDKLVYVNPRLAEILGAPIEEILNVPFIDYIYPDDREEVMTRYLKRLAGEKVADNYAFRVFNKRKEVIWLSISAKRITLKGKPATINMYTDITDEKKMESKISRLEKMESLGLLAGGVAHDLNNVLGIVMGYSQLLLLKADEKNDMKTDIDNIIKSSEKAVAMIDDLLTIARGGTYNETVININNIINKCIHSEEFDKLSELEPLYKIETDLGSDLNISGSEQRIYKALMNLINNAFGSMKNNNKANTLKITTVDRHLYKAISGYDDIESGDYVVVSISDTGDGISPTDLPHIFEPFYTKKNMGKSGTGLGLSVVWGTIKEHNGYIDVQSEVGVGTTFTLYFPVSRKNIIDGKVSESLSWYMGNNENILIVDDVDGQRMLAESMLSKLNYNVKSVTSGEDAIEYVKWNKVDVVVLDMIMDPGIDGLDTYKEILKINPKQKVIIMTGFFESDRIQGAINLGVSECIKKPYKIEALGLAVYKTIRNI